MLRAEAWCADRWRVSGGRALAPSSMDSPQECGSLLLSILGQMEIFLRRWLSRSVNDLALVEVVPDVVVVAVLV